MATLAPRSGSWRQTLHRPAQKATPTCRDACVHGSHSADHVAHSRCDAPPARLWEQAEGQGEAGSKARGWVRQAQVGQGQQWTSDSRFLQKAGVQQSNGRGSCTGPCPLPAWGLVQERSHTLLALASTSSPAIHPGRPGSAQHPPNVRPPPQLPATLRPAGKTGMSQTQDSYRPHCRRSMLWYIQHKQIQMPHRQLGQGSNGPY